MKMKRRSRRRRRRSRDRRRERRRRRRRRSRHAYQQTPFHSKLRLLLSTVKTGGVKRNRRDFRLIHRQKDIHADKYTVVGTEKLIFFCESTRQSLTERERERERERGRE